MQLIEKNHGSLKVWTWFDPDRQITVAKWRKRPLGNLLTFRDRSPFKSSVPGAKGMTNAKEVPSIGQARRIIRQVLAADGDPVTFA